MPHFLTTAVTLKAVAISLCHIHSLKAVAISLCHIHSPGISLNVVDSGPYNQPKRRYTQWKRTGMKNLDEPVPKNSD